MKLTQYLKKIDEYFDTTSLLNRPVTNKAIANYYSKSTLGYKAVDSLGGSMHTALNYGGKFDRKGLYSHPKLVEKQLLQLDATRVLELACGTGFNSLYLAERHPNIQFTALDLTPIHIQEAKLRSGIKKLENLSFLKGDYHQLEFPNNSFDCIFVIEGLCHSQQPLTVLKEMQRVLKPGGRAVIMDGFRTADLTKLNPDEQLAARLMARSMAVEEFKPIDDFPNLVRLAALQVIEMQDLSEGIMPHLIHHEKLAQNFFKFPWLAKPLAKALPTLTTNSIAAALMPYLVEKRIFGYYFIVIEKPLA